MLRGSATPLARDVEGRAVVGRGPDERHPQRRVHAGFEGHELEADEPLVVVQRHDHLFGVVEGLEENGVRGERAR